MLQVKQQILAGFKSCGYTHNLLKESYQYFDGVNDRTADMVGFYQSIYNSSTACIAAIDKTKLNENKLETELLSYQLLGCPVLLVYDNNGLQFWKNSGIQVALHEQIESKKLNVFFSKYKDEFSPENIYRAKTISRVKKRYQLSFSDIGGLMGIIEEKEGKYLSELTERIIRSLKSNCNGVKEDSKFDKWLFQAAFWLIGAKILKDKNVAGFKTLKISSVEDVVNKVQGHYNAAQKLDISNSVQRKALEKVAIEIVEPVSSFSHLTTESLAYVYENTLTSKETRKILGTHATPSWLVNYIVWEMIDWIEAIPQEERLILEPACGHAPFLTAGAKLLSSPLIYKGKEENRHKYLKEHLIGIDKDSFAEEIARLTLTLADIPNPNGWDIQHLDIYEGDTLKKAAQKTTIFFCNPPFENFTPKEKETYGNAITTGNKAAEVLVKTLPYLPPNSVFGIVLPQGFLHRKELAELRKSILDDFELRTICVLPETGIFGQSKHPVAVLLGRKVKSKKYISYIRIPKSHLEIFKNTYHARETSHSKNEFYMAEHVSFRVSELKEIWNFCKGYDKFRDIAEVGRGIEYKNFNNSVKKEEFKGAVKGFGRFEKRINGKKIDIAITGLPDYSWLSLEANGIQYSRSGTEIGLPQVLVNRQRSGANVWRIKGLIDLSGCPLTDSFLVIRPNQQISFSLYAIFAFVNSPYTSAYMFDNCMGRNNLEGTLGEMPIPFKGRDLSKLEALSKKYFEFDHSEFALKDKEKFKQSKKQCLLEIDAEVLRLYNLPPRLEKTLLDFFEGVPRKGVDFEFDRYYEEGFDSYIPLHMYISTEFRNSSVENVKKWIENNRTPEMIKAFKAAIKEKK
jgi:hypothetical protein